MRLYITKEGEQYAQILALIKFSLLCRTVPGCGCGKGGGLCLLIIACFTIKVS